jgi:hypothetical protein
MLFEPFLAGFFGGIVAMLAVSVIYAVANK